MSKNPLIGLFFSCFADRGQEATLKEDGIVYVYAVPNYEISYCDCDPVRPASPVAIQSVE